MLNWIWPFRQRTFWPHAFTVLGHRMLPNLIWRHSHSHTSWTHVPEKKFWSSPLPPFFFLLCLLHLLLLLFILKSLPQRSWKTLKLITLFLELLVSRVLAMIMEISSLESKIGTFLSVFLCPFWKTENVSWLCSLDYKINFSWLLNAWN